MREFVEDQTALLRIQRCEVNWGLGHRFDHNTTSRLLLYSLTPTHTQLSKSRSRMIVAETMNKAHNLNLNLVTTVGACPVRIVMHGST